MNLIEGMVLELWKDYVDEENGEKIVKENAKSLCKCILSKVKKTKLHKYFEENYRDFEENTEINQDNFIKMIKAILQ